MMSHLSVAKQGENQDTCSIDPSFAFGEREGKHNTSKKEFSWKKVELGEKSYLEST